MTFFVYVLRSLKDNKYYVGQTSNLEARIDYHNAGRQKSTKYRVPFKLVYYEELSSRMKAVKREKELKSGKGRDYIKTLRIGA
jgi:putative endonuclease